MSPLSLVAASECVLARSSTFQHPAFSRDRRTTDIKHQEQGVKHQEQVSAPVSSTKNSFFSGN